MTITRRLPLMLLLDNLSALFLLSNRLPSLLTYALDIILLNLRQIICVDCSSIPFTNK